MDVKNKRWSDEEFLKERKEVLAAWPTGKEVDLDEAIQYHKSQPASKNHVLKLRQFKEQRKIGFCSMMGTVPLERDIECALHLQNEGKSDFLTSVIDSMTRNHRFAAAERELKESERIGKPLLNGLPLAHYGVAGARKKVESVDLPVMIWGPSPDIRMVDEIGLAGGHSGVTHGGALVVFFHYTKDAPLEKYVHIFQYIYRLMAYYEERGVPMQHIVQGALSCITPPSLILAPQIIENLIAAEQGVKNIQYCLWGGQGSLTQAVASILTIRKLGDEYLGKFGYKDINTTTMAGYATNIPFPSDYAQAFAVVCMAPIVTLLSGSDVCYITTIDEAHKIPSKENNGASLRAARMMLDLLKHQKSDFTNSKTLKTECEMLERETRAILDRVVDLGDGDVVVGAMRAVEAGVLDQPFASTQRVGRKVAGVRDAEGSVRFLNHGNLPFSRDIVEFHKEKIAEREKLQGRKVDYDTVVSDIMAINKGALLLDLDWQERELAGLGAHR
jgi:methylaspartate mutase epsilon subunit